MREVMTPAQVAKSLQLNTDTVYRLIRQHKLATARIGRTYRIPREDVESLLLAHSTRPRARQVLFRRVLSVGASAVSPYCLCVGSCSAHQRPQDPLQQLT